MIKTYTYSGITKENYDTLPYYHIVKNPNALLSLGLICTDRDLWQSLEEYSIWFSFDNVSWFLFNSYPALQGPNSFPNNTQFLSLGSSVQGIQGIQVLPSHENLTEQAIYTMTVCEYYNPS